MRSDEVGRLAWAIVLTACVACVPASEEAPPAGAIGFVTEPTPATRGEPFVTSDGWTLRIEAIVLQVRMSATGSSTVGVRQFYGSSETYRFDASQSREVFARGIPVGPSSSSMSFQGSYLTNGDPDRTADRDEQTIELGVSAQHRARFLRPSEAKQQRQYPSYTGPAILLTVRGEREGRVMSLDLTMEIDSTYPSGGVQRDVRANALVSGRMAIVAEALFAHYQRPGDLVFDEFVAADTNDDGQITGSEIDESTACFECNAGGGTKPKRFYDIVRARANGILREQ